MHSAPILGTSGTAGPRWRSLTTITNSCLPGDLVISTTSTDLNTGEDVSYQIHHICCSPYGMRCLMSGTPFLYRVPFTTPEGLSRSGQRASLVFRVSAMRDNFGTLIHLMTEGHLIALSLWYWATVNGSMRTGLFVLSNLRECSA